MNMELDEEYLKIVNHILTSDLFLKLKNCEHHGITRFEHSLKVSYNAYKFAKRFNLDYKSVAIGGLLHDFFLDENVKLKDRFFSVFNHPLKAEINALEKFNVSSKEADIIRSHMFPINTTLPKYKESWIVSMYDKKIAFSEFGHKFGYKLKYVSNLVIILLFNVIK